MSPKGTTKQTKQTKPKPNHNSTPHDLLVQPVDRNVKPNTIPLSTYAERQRTKHAPKESHDILVGATPVWFKRASVNADILSAWDDKKKKNSIDANRGGFDIRVLPNFHCLTVDHDNNSEIDDLATTAQVNKLEPIGNKYVDSSNEQINHKAEEMIGYIMQKSCSHKEWRKDPQHWDYAFASGEDRELSKELGFRFANNLVGASYNVLRDGKESSDLEKLHVIHVIYTEGEGAGSQGHDPDVRPSTLPWQQLFGVFETLSKEIEAMTEHAARKHLAKFVFDRADPEGLGTLLVANAPHIVTSTSWVYFLAITLMSKDTLAELEGDSGLVWSSARYNQTIYTCIGEYAAKHQLDIVEAMHIFYVLREMLKAILPDRGHSESKDTDEPAPKTAEGDDGANTTQPGPIRDTLSGTEVEDEQTIALAPDEANASSEAGEEVAASSTANPQASSRASKRKATDQGVGKGRKKTKAVKRK